MKWYENRLVMYIAVLACGLWYNYLMGVNVAVIVLLSMIVVDVYKISIRNK